MCYGHEKAPRNPKISGALRMVGVARIELATPTMSTQRVNAKKAEKLGFLRRMAVGFAERTGNISDSSMGITQISRKNLPSRSPRHDR